MENNWIINTHGDPLGAVRDFVRNVWLESNLDGMLVPANGSTDARLDPRIIYDPALLDEFNPFKPLMSVNVARHIPAIVLGYPRTHLGVMLRPCEMRALVEMTKRNGFSLDKLLTFSVDCLGTFPEDEFRWRAERKGSPDKLTQEALQFAKQGGIMAYRYRSACQLCVSPNARNAHLNISILGLPVRSYIVISVRDEATASRMQLESITDGPVIPARISQREKLLSKLEERRGRTRSRVTAGIADILPNDVEALIDQFEGCGDCQDCLDACPICSVEFPRRGEDNRYLTLDIKRWMVSCAGCGMCEQACPRHRPLSAIFTYIHQQLSEEFDYIPGVSIEESLPLMI